MFEELHVSIWVRGNRPGLQLGLRIVFPAQLDPRTGEPLTVDMYGDRYELEQRWQRLECRTPDTEIRKLVGRLQAQLGPSLPSPSIDARGMYVDRVVLVEEVKVGSTEWAIDDLQIAPLVDPASNGAELAQTSAAEATRGPVTLGDGRLLYQGQPYFPIICPYHGEELELLRSSGFNVIWVPRYDDEPLLRALAETGLGAMAEPPAAEVRPVEQDADGSTPRSIYNVGLPSFSSETSNILLWTLGAEIDPSALASVRAAAEAVRDADPSRRPVLADVTGSEREFHRSVDVLGVSRQAVHTSVSPLGYAGFLDHAARQALRGKPLITWVFTEPNPANLKNRDPRDRVPYVEPEQIWMQVWAAVGAGVKGIGYFRRTPFDPDDPLSVERLHAMRLANLQLYLLRDWLASGKVMDVAPVRLGEGKSPVKSNSRQPFVTAWNRAADSDRPRDAIGGQVRAPVLQTPFGWLLLPQWLEQNAQYQPGVMAVEDVRIMLRGVDGVHAWEVTTTGVHPYQVDVTPEVGGSEIRLKRLDQTAAILITTDASAIETIKREAYSMQRMAAESWLALAEAKLTRVQSVHDELQKVSAAPYADGDYILAEAHRELKTARESLTQGSSDQVRSGCQRILRLTRQVQRAHWDAANSELHSPVATPYSICFQTLPDFWRFWTLKRDSIPSANNLLRGGDLEQWGPITADQWGFDVVPSSEDVIANVAIVPDGRNGSALRMAAMPATAEIRAGFEPKTPIRIAPKSVPVFSGQLVSLKGAVWFEHPRPASRTG
ncbi:MAG: hypothetical protein R3B90_08115 [Planctomycetaceae bacterium]